MQDSRGRFVAGTHWRPHRQHWDAEWLRARYVAEEMSAAEIAVSAGCTEGNIYYWLDKHEIPRRSISAARAVKYWGASGDANPMHGRTGALNPRYVDGGSPERQRLYAQGVGKAFLRSVLLRDGYECRMCGVGNTGRRSLHVHHIRPWAGNPSCRFDNANVVTLCQACHSWVHSKSNSEGVYLDA
jgi:hypothetical protein